MISTNNYRKTGSALKTYTVGLTTWSKNDTKPQKTGFFVISTLEILKPEETKMTIDYLYEYTRILKRSIDRWYGKTKGRHLSEQSKKENSPQDIEKKNKLNSNVNQGP